MRAPTERHRPCLFRHKAPGPVPGPPAGAGTEHLPAAATTFCPARPPVSLLCLPRRGGGGNFPGPVPALRRVGRPLCGAGAAAGPRVSCSLRLLSSCLRCRQPNRRRLATRRHVTPRGPARPREGLCVRRGQRPPCDAEPRTRGLPAAPPFAPEGAEGSVAGARRVHPAEPGIA